MHYFRSLLLLMVFYTTLEASNHLPYQPKYKPKESKPLDYFASRRVENRRSRYGCCEYGRCRGFFETCTDCNTCVNRYNLKEIFRCKMRPNGRCLQGSGGGSDWSPWRPWKNRFDSRTRLRCSTSQHCPPGERCLGAKCEPLSSGSPWEKRV